MKIRKKHPKGWKKKKEKKPVKDQWIDTPSGRFYYGVPNSGKGSTEWVKKGLVNGKRTCIVRMFKISKQMFDVFKETEIFREDGRRFETTNEISLAIFYKRIWDYIKKKKLQNILWLELELHQKK